MTMLLEICHGAKANGLISNALSFFD